MIQRKRLLALVLAVMMIAALFAGCDGGGNSSGSSSNTNDSATEGSTSSSTTTDAITVDQMMESAEIALGEEGIDSEITLKVWGPEKYQALLKEQCARFEKNFSDQGRKIKIEVAVQGEGNVSEQIRVDSNAAADVFGLAGDHAFTLARDGYLAPVRTTFLPTVQSENIEGTYSFASLDLDGNGELLYGYPETGENGYAMFYDKSVLSEDDVKTMESLMAACEREKKSFMFNVGDGFYGCTVAFTGGGQLSIADDNKTQAIDFDFDKIYPVAKAFSDLFAENEYYIDNDVNAGLASGFTNKTVCAGVIGSWGVADMENALGDDMAVVKLPTLNIDGTDTQLVTASGSKMLGVNAHSKFPYAAQSLAFYLSGEECQMERLETLNWGPSNIAVTETDAFKNNEPLSAIYAQQETSVHQANLLSSTWSSLATFASHTVNKDKDRSEEGIKEVFDGIVENIELG